MAKRLFKIAKEFNVGTATIVDHLRSKDYDISNKPNAIISDEMYDDLLVAFQSSADVKEQAEKLVIGQRIEAEKKREEKEEPKKKVSSISGEIQRLAELKKAGKDGSILDELDTKESEKQQSTEEDQEPTTIETNVDSGIISEESSVDEKSPTTEVEKPKDKSTEEKESDKIDDKKVVEDKKTVKKASDSGGLKVVGKIDLDVKKKKKKAPVIAKEKTSDEKTEDTTPSSTKQTTSSEKGDDKVDADLPKSEVTSKDAEKVESKSSEAEEDVMKVKAPTLKGLKVMGKIDPDKLKKPKKTKTEDSTSKRKRKRKRKTISKTDTRNKRNKQTTRGRGKSKEGEDNAVSQKEIDEKIKATMARMSGTGKSKRQKTRKDKRESLKEKQAEELANSEENMNLEVTEFISVSELANLMDASATDIIMACMNLGVIVSINQRLDAELIELVTSEFGYEVEFISAEEQIDDEDDWEDNPEDLEPRAPIVTVMGHVDHGKTSLLDFIREANVASGEAGGITQHIGAYEVMVGDKKVTFLDTPGHEAFTAMRARGAKVTDVAVIIIAADDKIMPQTKEAISHAEAADVPIVFAINKIDKDGADPDRIINELAQMNYLVEAWGGKYQSQNISAKQGLNIDKLLEKITLEAEVLELKANPNRPALGTVIEASLDKGRGYVTKVLVQNGTLNIGDPIVAGEHSGKIKAMFNERGTNVESVGPSQPTLILGFSGAPQAGEIFKEMETEQEAKSLANKRSQIMREQSNRASKRISLDEIGRRLALGTFKELNLIVKGDVDGSVEALADSLIKLSVETIQVNVIHKAVGQIIESDVLLASASDAIIIGFQVRPSGGARKLAETEGVQIKTYSIIYEAIEEIKLAMEGMLEPTEEEKVIGQVEVREVYKISKVGTVAGCYIQEGKINRNSNVRIIRDGIVVYPTKEGVTAELASLKRYKEDVKELKAGMECGISIKNFNDLKVGDMIEPYEIIKIAQTL